MNASAANDGEPPLRYRGTPKGTFKFSFGKAAVDKFCGRPPCLYVFMGCARGNRIVVLDPFGPDGARVIRHELAHLNGWSKYHGD